MSLKIFRGRNLDNVMVGKIMDDSSYYAPSATRMAFEKVKELTFTLEMDTDENKVEGYIDDLYSKILKISGSLTGGALPLEVAAMIFNGDYDADTGYAWWHIEAGSYLPYLFLDAQGLYDPDGGTADNRVIGYKIKPFGFETGLGQEGYTEVSFDFEGIFTLNEVDRAKVSSKRVASFGRQATAATTLGNLIETEAAA